MLLSLVLQIPMDIVSQHTKSTPFRDTREPPRSSGPVSQAFRAKRCQLTWLGHPATLEAYIDRYSALVPYLANNVMGSPTSDTPPPEQTSAANSLQVCTSVSPLHPFLAHALYVDASNFRQRRIQQIPWMILSRCSL